jgi:hypothetical protein
MVARAVEVLSDRSLDGKIAELLLDEPYQCSGLQLSMAQKCGRCLEELVQ